MENELRRSQERFAKLFNSSPVAIVLSRLSDGAYQEVNDAFLKMTGYSREELIGDTSLELGILSTPAVRAGLLARMDEHGHVHVADLVIRVKQGTFMDVLYSIDHVAFDGETWLLSSLFDISSAASGWKQR